MLILASQIIFCRTFNFCGS